jgi:post-segregation antitoxin (ccd killing protein)
MTENKNKERTSITIDPELLARARAHCVEASNRTGRKVSFSELVSVAVDAHITAASAPSE